MTRIIYKQITFSEVTPNKPFYLIHPDTVLAPAVPAVHYPCEEFCPNTKIWTDEEADGNQAITKDKTRLCLKEDSNGNWQPLFSEGFM